MLRCARRQEAISAAAKQRSRKSQKSPSMSFGHEREEAHIPAMKALSERTIKRLGQHVTGDGQMTPYRSGPRLVALFNEHGCNEVYPSGGGFPSRWMFAEEHLRQINGTEDLVGLIEEVFDPLGFEQFSRLDPSPAVEDLNQYLRRDGYQLIIVPDGARLKLVNGASVPFMKPPAYRPATEKFITEHIQKCEAKLREVDFSGAITNARSLCEEVFSDIEKNVDPNAPKYDGDLPRLYKRVRKFLRLEPDAYKDREDVAQMLRGLTTLVDGLSGISNSLADRHGGSGARPKPHHAHLAVNAANTLCTFILSAWADTAGAPTGKS